MDQRKEAVFRYIDEHRQEILDDWKALVNHEGSLRQPDAMARRGGIPLRTLPGSRGGLCGLQCSAGDPAGGSG